jgi:hypothetical protein
MPAIYRSKSITFCAAHRGKPNNVKGQRAAVDWKESETQAFWQF